MSSWLADLRYAARGLAKAPAFTATVLATLALGIGLNSAAFSIVHGVLWKPLALAEPERLLTAWENHQARGGPPQEWTGRSVFSAWRERTRSFAALTAVLDTGADLTGLERPERIRLAAVSHEYFEVLGVAPALGRGFVQADEVEGQHRVAVVTDELWHSRLGGDPRVLERSLTLNAETYQVVGVLPPSLPLPFSPEAQVIVPLSFGAGAPDVGNYFLRVVGRLGAGVSPATAQADMDRVAAELGSLHPEHLKDVGIRLVPLIGSLTAEARLPLLALLAAVALVLAIACVNVANLALTRATVRHREMAVRTALGADRGRLLGQLLVENLLLGLGGGALGLLLGLWGVEIFRALAPADLPRLAELRLDGRAIAFTALVSVAAGLLAGLAPAASGARAGAAGTLRSGRGELGGQGRVRSALVTAELALGLALLVSAGLMVRTLDRLAAVEPGFRAEGLLTGAVGFTTARVPEVEQVLTRVEAMESRLAGHPAVQAVGATSVMPLSGSELDLSFGIEGRMPERGHELGADHRTVTPGYFQTMGIPVLAGRAFSPSDRAGTQPVALISQRFAELHFPGEEPLGKRMKIGGVHDPERPWLTVVGVVGSVRDDALAISPEPEMYTAFAQRPARRLRLVVRSSLGPGPAAELLRSAVFEVDPDQALAQVNPVSRLVERSLAPTRLLRNLFGFFSLLALGLAALGVYGVIAYAVRQREPELGIRLALGATRENVRGLVLAWGGRLVLAGMAIGLVAALLLARGMAGLLYGVAAFDPATLAGVTALLAAVALAACWIPATRAARTDPMTTLRGE